MSASEMNRLLRDVEGDKKLKIQLENIGDVNARIAAAVSAGYKIEKSDLAVLNKEMSEHDLNSVSGGHRAIPDYWW